MLFDMVVNEELGLLLPVLFIILNFFVVADL